MCVKYYSLQLPWLIGVQLWASWCVYVHHAVCNNDLSVASSLCVDPESSLFISTLQPPSQNRCWTPTSPSLPADTDHEQLFLSLDQTKLEESMRARCARTPEPGLGRLKRSGM